MQDKVDASALASLVGEAGVEVPAQALAPLALYLESLCRWNKAMNLTGAATWQQAWQQLAQDSFHLAPFLRSLLLPAEPECWDLGAGAGLPGIPLRMVWPCGRYHLVEAREKRALFLGNMLARLDLPNTGVFHGRAEDFFAKATSPADCIISRAFMPWRRLLAFAGPHLAPDGLMVFMANDPLPHDLPAGWRAVASHAYATAGERYFWALARQGGAAA